MSTEVFSFSMRVTRVLILGTGFLGHIVSFLIFSRKAFRKNSISTYCQALAIFECLTMNNFAYDITQLIYKVNLNDQSDFLCKLISYIPHLYHAIPAWILVAFSLDKLFSMRSISIPLLKKKWFQWSLVAGIVLFNLLFYLLVPVLVNRRQILPGVYLCDLSTIGFYNIFTLAYITESCIIPFIIMIISSILTVRSLIKSRNSVEKNGTVNKERKSRDTKYAISSITLNVLFITLKLPVLANFTLTAFSFPFNLYFTSISILLFVLNSSSHFLVYLVTNSLFRRELLVFFRLKQSTAEMSNTNATLKTNRVSPMSIQ